MSTDLPQLARDLDYVKANIGTVGQDTPAYYEAADRVLAYGAEQLAARIANGAPKPEARAFAPGTIGADQRRLTLSEESKLGAWEKLAAHPVFEGLTHLDSGASLVEDMIGALDRMVDALRPASNDPGRGVTDQQRKAWQAGATLGEVEAMGSAPAVTDEQRAAWKRIHEEAAGLHGTKALIEPDDLALIVSLLPPELTNPQPVLPTEKGTTIYGGRDQPRTMFRIANVERHWVDEHGERYTDDEARDLMGEWEETPPSVTERPQITREQIPRLLAPAFKAGLPGTTQFNDALHDALLNGADQ